MRKKFVQTLAARQLEYGEDSRTNEDMDSEKQPSAELQQAQQQQQADNSAEEIIEILDDDQEVELMMERHRKYHPRKYVNLQHPPSKIYYDKIDKVVSPVGDKEDQEDEDERNQLVIEESSPKELNNNSISAANIGSSSSSSSVGGSFDDSVLSLRSSIPRNEEEAYLLQEYHYQRLYGGYGGHIPVNGAPGGHPSSRDQQEAHQQRLKKSSQRALDPPGTPLMGPPAYPHPVGHPQPYERSHPYGQRPPVSYERSVPGPQTPYYRKKEARRMSLHERPRAAHAELNGSFLVPEARTEFAKAGGNRNSAFSPPHDKGHSTMRVSEANKTRAPRPPAPPTAAVASAIVTPCTPPYYPQPRAAYHQSGTSSAHRSREANSYLALAEWYRTGVPPLHMITASDLQSMCYYTYYMDKMAAAPSVYHHSYRDHTLTATTTTVGPGIGGIGTVPTGSVSAVALGSPSYPPPQYGFARSPTDHTALYPGAQQQPFDYTVYQNVLAQSGYMPTPTCQPQTAITAASMVQSSYATSSSMPASEIIRPTVINRAPIPTTVPQNVPRTVPVNLVHPPTPPTAHAGPPATTVDRATYPSDTSSRSDHRTTTILKPLLTRPLAVTEGEDEKNKRHRGDGGRVVVVNFATATAPAISSEKSKPGETVPPTSSPGVPSKPVPSSASPKGDNSASRTATAPNHPPAAHIIPLTMSMPPSRPRGRPPGAKNKESSAAARATRANASATPPSGSSAVATAGASGSADPHVVHRLSSTTIKVRVDCMKQEVDCFLNKRRTEVITTMRLYSIGRIDFDGLLQEMKRHSIVYRDFLSVAYELIRNARLPGFVREPPAELDYRWKSPPQEFADYFAKNEQCSRTFVRENFDFLSLIVDNLLKQYFEPLEYFLLTYVLGLRVK